MRKYWHIISLSLFVLLIVSLFFWPEISDLVAIVLFFSSLIVCIFFIVRRNLEARHEVPPIRITFRILIEILVALAVVFVAYLAGMATGHWLGLLAGMAVAFGMVWLLNYLVRRLVRQIQ